MDKQVNEVEKSKKFAGILTKEMVLFFGFVVLGICVPQIFHLIGQQQLGMRLSPMHVFALLCGFVCGKKYGGLCGFTISLLSSLIFGMPKIFPTALAMAFEMMAYGYITGLLKDKMHYVFALLIALVGGRVVLGLVNIPLFAMNGGAYSFATYINSLFVFGWPSIVASLAIVSLVVFVLVKLHAISFKK